MGCRPIRRRSPGVQEADLRNALRPRQRGVCPVRTILRGSALPRGEAGEIVEQESARLMAALKKNGARTMSTSRRSMFYSLWALLLWTDAAMLSAQTAIPREPQCFRIHAHLNGEPMNDPQVITLKTEQNDSTLTLEGNCFRVPPTFLTEKALDITFTIPGARFTSAESQQASSETRRTSTWKTTSSAR